jgi:hypothetical protein
MVGNTMVEEDKSAQFASAPEKPQNRKASNKEQVRKTVKKARKDSSKRSRTPRIYPALSFEASLTLADAIHTYASGERVARLTLLKQMNLSPTSSATQILITSSSKYGITTGSFAADHLELTPVGRVASDKASSPRPKAQARFDLAIKNIKPFEVLYDRYRGKKLPSHDVMRDTLKEAKLEITDDKECIDTFIVNAKFLGLLQTIAGSETLLPIEMLLEQLPDTVERTPGISHTVPVDKQSGPDNAKASHRSQSQWQSVCFYITPIGDEGSDQRKHSDLFLSSIIEPALAGFGLEVVRADMIGQPGMITSQVLEHILRSKLVIADLSYHNPNVFYEMALRHATKLPIIQICRKSDRLPFDVNQVRTISIDTTDIYTLIPKLETYRSEIASIVRAALDGQGTSNPMSVFFPGITVNIPKV